MWNRTITTQSPIKSEHLAQILEGLPKHRVQGVVRNPGSVRLFTRADGVIAAIDLRHKANELALEGSGLSESICDDVADIITQRLERRGYTVKG